MSEKDGSLIVETSKTNVHLKFCRFKDNNITLKEPTAYIDCIDGVIKFAASSRKVDGVKKTETDSAKK